MVPAREDRMMSKKNQEIARKPAREPKARREKKANEPLVVFAFRLRAADRALIHKAAGPAKATRFVLSAALAAASGDKDAFEALASQAKANLK
jgi:hypothetical protein